MLDEHKLLSRFSSIRKENEAVMLLKHAFDIINNDANDERLYPILHALHVLFVSDASALSNLPILQLEHELQIDHETAINLFSALKMHFIMGDDVSWLKNHLLSAKINNDKKTKDKEDQLHGLEFAGQEYDTAERRRKKKLPEFKAF